MSNSSWCKLNMLNKTVAKEVVFGSTEFVNQRCWLYPNRALKKYSTIIWIPSKHVHIGIASYVDANRNNDEEALSKLESVGIPRNINFGYKKTDDLTSLYTVIDEEKKAVKKKKADSVKIMRAQFGSTYEDGSAFKAGDIVKIIFRKKFVSDKNGIKKFVNVYEKPTSDEIKAFMKTEI